MTRQNHALYGTCATWIEYTVDKSNRVRNIVLQGGCPGMKQAFSILAEGRDIDVLIKMLSGIKCRNNTSCADQVARALISYKESL